MGASEAYEKMLKDGSAFKEIDMTQHMEPNVSDAIGGGGSAITKTMGERTEIENVKEEISPRDNFDEFDSVMEQRIQSLRAKMKGEGREVKKVGRLMTPTQKEILALKKRISKLEEALMIVMETHEQLLGE